MGEVVRFFPKGKGKEKEKAIGPPATLTPSIPGWLGDVLIRELALHGLGEQDVLKILGSQEFIDVFVRKIKEAVRPPRPF